MKQITDSGNCFGCSLCHDACSFGAITMSMDRGFYRPVIDEDLCKDCGKCEKLCPANSLDELTTQKHEPKECYAAWSLDDALHFNCASGGLTTEIAKAFIKNGGFVVGCRLNKESLLAEHYIIESENDLPEMAKSKYVHSDKTGLYKKASELLKSKKCLFIGVSCEVMAFLKFLKTVTAVTQQVYTINLLCHGGASPRHTT